MFALEKNKIYVRLENIGDKFDETEKFRVGSIEVDLEGLANDLYKS